MYFVIFTPSFQLCINFAEYLSWNSVHFQCCFLFMMWLSLWMFCKGIVPFIFRIPEYPYPSAELGQVLCIKLTQPYRNYRQLCKLNPIYHLWKFEVRYVLPPAPLVLLGMSMFLVEHVTGQFRFLILIAPCWMEDTWLPILLNMFEEISI